jgi:predicted transcriptional regulator of viral defense system
MECPYSKREEQLRQLALGVKTLRARDLNKHGIARSYLRQLVERGVLEQAGRGLYTLANADVSEYQTLIEASTRVSHGVICLASALRFHGLTTQNPWKVWMLIETGKRVPKVDYPPLLFFQASGPSFTEGIETHLLNGASVKVTSVAKTVADCFKFRNKIGLDVALEALRECLRERRATREELHYFARICRVDRIMKPYMEAFAVSLCVYGGV